MKIYKYWARGEATVRDDGRPWILRAYGGSNRDLDDAQRRAGDAAARAAMAVERGDPAGRYGYADRPLREEVVREIGDASPPAGIITRNGYGALVLNTSRAMFVDVDDDTGKNAGGPTLGEILRELWNGIRGKPPLSDAARNEQRRKQFQEVAQSRPLGLRIYRTAAGFRLLVTNKTFDPKGAETGELLAALGADPLYVRLCSVQECFRARLSAKYWRCGATPPPSRFPWSNSSEEATYRKWEQEYHRRANQYATCELVEVVGDSTIHADLAPIVEVHDRLTMRPGALLA